MTYHVPATPRRISASDTSTEGDAGVPEFINQLEKQMKIKLDNRNSTLFWLRRRIKQLESLAAPLTQAEMAEIGLSYGARREELERAADRYELTKNELTAFQTALSFLEEHSE